MERSEQNEKVEQKKITEYCPRIADIAQLALKTSFYLKGETNRGLPCNNTFCVVGSLGGLKLRARPGKAKCDSIETSQKYRYETLKRETATSSVGVPATLNILSNWSKTSLTPGKQG